MTILILLIPLAVLLGGFFLIGFIIAVNNGQFDDLDTPAYRILDEKRRAK